MTAMPHLAAIDWDHADRMQSADLGGGGTVWFLYDSAGNRVRKIRVNQAGTSTNERIYLGGYEVYREHVGTELRLERETLHIADDSGRICLVETKTIDDADVVPLPANISRYQYGNHLGSVGMELDETGQLISYEEFHPYGTTAYRAANSAVDVSPSRYRYTGQERDEETGLGHHGARYYAGWLARWTAADPIGIGDGINRYAYVSGNPVGLVDPTGRAGTTTAELYDDPGTDQAATVNADIAELTQKYMRADTDAERQTIKETIGLLREAAGFTRHREPAATPSWLEEARSNKRHADETTSKIGDRRDALSMSAVEGTAAIFAVGGVLGTVAAGVGIAAEAGLFGRAVILASEEAELFAIATESSPLFAAGVTTVGAAAEAESVATGAPPGSGGSAGQAPRGRLASAPTASTAAKDGGQQGERILFHYTDAPESSFQRGLWSGSSATDDATLTAREAVEQLGVKTAPDKIIPIRAGTHFRKNNPHIVEPHPLGPGGGKDFTNNNRVPSQDILPALPVRKRKGP